jgi:localization factor PodJL
VIAAWRTLDAERDVAAPGAAPEPAPPFAPIDEIDAELFETAPPPPQGPGPQLSTREVIEQARAAARAQRGEEVPLEVRAKVEPKAAGGRFFQGFGGRPRRENTTLQTALMIAGGAAFFSVSAAGLTLLQGEQAREEARATPPLSPAPRAAMALSAPGPTAPMLAAAALTAPAGPSVDSRDFAKVHSDVEAGAPGALETLQGLAAGGHAQAQLYLGQLYDEGGAGLVRNPAQARRLTALAAEAGEVKAMHNLGVYLFEGEGGPADATAAAVWFRRAAEAGLVESQYNLGLLYQSGSGVARDAGQARQWFTRAAARGDVDARRALAALAPPTQTLAAKAPAAIATPAAPPPAAQARATAPRTPPPRPAPTATAAAGASPNVQQAQVILTRLGYYQGPADGLSNEAYKVALFRYQKDQRDHAPGPRPPGAEIAER